MSDCRFAHDAAAYVLGALEPGEREAFEAHLPGCPTCSGEVREFTELPGVLAHAPVEDMDAPPPPEDLLGNLVVEVRRSRRRRLLRSVLVTAAAIVVFAVAAVTAVTTMSPAEPAPTLDVALDPVATVSVSSEAGMVAQNEGTRIELSCDDKGGGKSDGGYGGGDKPAYRLVVTNVKGETEVAGSWTAAEDGSTRVVLFTRWKPENIAALEIQDLDEHALLRWQKA